MAATLVPFDYALPPRDQSAAYMHAIALARTRGEGPPPARYRERYLSIRIHPGDVATMRAYCQALDLDAGRIPTT